MGWPEKGTKGIMTTYILVNLDTHEVVELHSNEDIAWARAAALSPDDVPALHVEEHKMYGGSE
jgi:hypothetical protein